MTAVGALLLAACSQATSAATQPQKQLPRHPPLQVDYSPPPSDWKEALDRADVVAVITLKGLSYERGTGPVRTVFTAEIIQLVKAKTDMSIGAQISVMRFGGLREIRGVTGIVEERNFESWAVGQTLLVFLKWAENFKAYSLPAGPDSAFEVSPKTNKIRVFANTTFAGRQSGRDIAAVLAELRAAR